MKRWHVNVYLVINRANQGAIHIQRITRGFLAQVEVHLKRRPAAIEHIRNSIRIKCVEYVRYENSPTSDLIGSGIMRQDVYSTVSGCVSSKFWGSELLNILDSLPSPPNTLPIRKPPVTITSVPLQKTVGDLFLPSKASQLGNVEFRCCEEEIFTGKENESHVDICPLFGAILHRIEANR
jgi:hypothetical protein